MITTTDTRLFRSLVVEVLRLDGYDNYSFDNSFSDQL